MENPLKVYAEADTPESLAWRMTEHNKDARWIRAMVLREYGRAPSVARIREAIEYRQDKAAWGYEIDTSWNPVTSDEMHRNMMQKGSERLAAMINAHYVMGARHDAVAA